MNLEEHITELVCKVVSLEGEYGFLVEQIKGVHKRLMAFEAETRRNFEGASSERARMPSDVRSIRSDAHLLRDDLPGLVGGAVRDALRD